MIVCRLTVSAISICGFLFASGVGGHGNSAHEGGWMEKWLSFDPGLFMWTIVTFLIVLLILKWKAWGPLIQALDKREEDIRQALTAAEKAKEEADKVAEEYDEMIRKAQSEAQKIVAESKTTGERVREELKETAEKEARDILDKAQVQIDSEKEVVMGIGINANHLNAVEKGWVIGKATPIKVGKRIQVWQIKIENEKNKPVCISTLTLAVVQKR